MAYRRQLLSRLRQLDRPDLAVLLVTLLVREALPAMTAVAIGRLVAAVTSTTDGELSALALPFGMLAAAVLLAQLTEVLAPALRYAAARRVDGVYRARVAADTLALPNLADVEDQQVRDDIRLAAARPGSWTERTPGEAAVGQLGLLLRLIGAVSAAAVVATYSWTLVLALAVAVTVTRVVLRNQSLAIAKVWAIGVSDLRRGEYWQGAVIQPGGAKEIRIFGQTDWIIGRWRGHLHDYLGPLWRKGDAISRYQWTVFVLLAGAGGGALYTLGSATVAGRLSVAGLAAALTATVALLALGGLEDDSFAVAGAVPALAAQQRLARRFVADSGCGRIPVARPEASGDAADPARRPPLIAFQDVRFSYPNAVRPTLDGLSFEIRPGEVLALVGANGAGKSTVTKLLTGLYEPDAGRITAAGVTAGEATMDEWRQQFAVVFQDFGRYQLTLAENVGLGAPARADDPVRILAAGKMAGLQRLVDTLPAGWATPISSVRSGGVDLSGGQWQHVALARALFAVRSGARVLVLDEPTAHLDVRTEVEIFRRILREVHGVTVVLISHRLSTIRAADRIVMLAGGRVVEEGTHDELLAAGGRYAAMLRDQATGVDETVGGEDAERTVSP